MGQKVNPIGLRLGINRTWDSRWFADGADYGRLLHEDIKVRRTLKKRLYQAGVSRIIIERPTNYGIIGVKVWVFKGEVLDHDPMALDKRLATESGPAGEGGGRDRSGDRPDRGPRRDRREAQNA